MEVVKYLVAPHACSGRGLHKLYPVLGERETRSALWLWVLGGFEGQTSARGGSRLHVASLYDEKPVVVRPTIWNKENTNHNV